LLFWTNQKGADHVYLDFIERRDNDALYALEPSSHDASEEIRRFMVFNHHHIADIEKLLRIVMPQIILDPSLLPIINDPSVLRGAVVLADRLRALQATGAIRADADLLRIATLVVWQSISLSFLMRHMSGGRDGEVLRLIDVFAVTLGSGLG
jgi:hypothetical protein